MVVSGFNWISGILAVVGTILIQRGVDMGYLKKANFSKDELSDRYFTKMVRLSFNETCTQVSQTTELSSCLQLQER